jgi:hypothetical protein
VKQCLHHNAILLGLSLERGQLLLCCLRGADIEIHPYALKSDRTLFRHSQSSLQIQIALNGHADRLCSYAHSCGYHLASDLRTGGKRAE